MISPRLMRPLVALALSASVLGAGGALAASAPAKLPVKLGPNLVVNPSFEDSTVDAATANKIPVMPKGWTFEGATVLFDYNQRGGHTGQRNAAISGSLAPGKQFCDATTGSFTCAPNPAAPVTGQVNDKALSTYSIRPFWVNEAAMQVSAGKTYRCAMWSIRPSFGTDIDVVGEGPISKVRWLNAAGSVITVVDGPKALKGTKKELSFRLSSADLVAPAGAVAAKVLLGRSDYTSVAGQVAFDDISFQQVLA